ncbi:50S ribosomal protein L3 N(5)-glutamine methyltransferase [Larsenimonas rhizosphaerae]|uniref:50S ribosomal protein L3 N(5)-glutamine methyltransferase n=1 Tax=Larsenimonas rhizosphaerae TaxID=2944682 RepID=UPI0020333379|nr:50S ribosomal protein L3 N(5)-glutamine methyltransferase [Larsenimonas rhizosphaerae]
MLSSSFPEATAPVDVLALDDATLADEVVTLRDCIRLALSCFQAHRLYYGHGTASAWDEAVALVLGALHLPHDVDPAVIDARVLMAERRRIIALIRRRALEREPLPYLLGEAWFAGLPFEVTPDVLIPRSPIAELIEEGFIDWFDDAPPARVLDLCTGSGCIGIATAMVLSTTEVVLSDISNEALAVARRNIDRFDTGGRVSAVHSDVFDHLAGERFDLIVSNPPYVDARDMTTMPAEFGHEPELALAAGDDGLDIVRRILADAHRHLTPQGVLIVEVGNSAQHLEAAFPDVPFHWLSFERGGEGVFALTFDALVICQDILAI